MQILTTDNSAQKNSEGLYLWYCPLLFFELAEVDAPLSR